MFDEKYLTSIRTMHSNILTNTPISNTMPPYNVLNSNVRFTQNKDIIATNVC